MGYDMNARFIIYFLGLIYHIYIYNIYVLTLFGHDMGRQKHNLQDQIKFYSSIIFGRIAG